LLAVVVVAVTGLEVVEVAVEMPGLASAVVGLEAVLESVFALVVLATLDATLLAARFCADCFKLVRGI
jgi:hypothetical protein